MLKTTRLLKPLMLLAAVSLSACGGGGTAVSTSTVPAGNTNSGTVSGATNAFTISGVVTGTSAATLNLSGVTTASTGTDSSGNYSFGGLDLGNYTVTPGQTGFLFSPISRAESVTTASLTDVVFSATASTAPTYTVSGTVSGSVVAGVEITLNGTNIGSTITDLSGNYSFPGLASGTYTVSAALDGYSFSAPLIISLSNTDSLADNFTSSVQAAGTLAFAPLVTLPQATVGAAYSQSTVESTTGGTAPYRYQVGPLEAGTPPLGMIVNPSGQLTGTPTVTGVYEFSVCALDSAGNVSTCEPTSITVVAVADTNPPPTPVAAATVSLAASPATITTGATSSLTWTSKNATSCSASGGWSGTKGTSGTTNVSPTSTTTYSISCAGTGGAGKTSVVVTVKPVTPVAAAPTVTLTPTAATVTSGTASTLTWSSKNAVGCTASGGWTGSKSLSGTLSVTPANTTTYTLTCTSAGGSASASSKITVSAATAGTPAPTVKLAAGPATITTGSASTLTWSSTNADSCTASGGWTGARGDSGTASVSPTATSTYSLTCSGAGGSAKASATVTVNAVATSTTPASGTFWVYQNGTFNWGGDYDFMLSSSYRDTSSPMAGHTWDLKNSTNSAYGGWLPYAGGLVPLWAMDVSKYTKFTFSVKPTQAGQTFQFYFVQVGDVQLPSNCWISDTSSELGAAPAGVWTTYTINLSRVCIGKGLTGGTVVYKFAIQDQSGSNNNTWYVDNVGFVP